MGVKESMFLQAVPFCKLNEAGTVRRINGKDANGRQLGLSVVSLRIDNAGGHAERIAIKKGYGKSRSP
jgi:hypothetical protein